MAKVSNKRMARGNKRTGSKSVRRSRTMKKAKQGTKKAAVMKGMDKPRKVYCVSCRKKVIVCKYDLKPTPKGAYQLVGECPNKTHKLDKNGDRKVYSFVSAKSV